MHHGVNKTVLDNGVKILSKKMSHVRSVSMGVWVNAGARDESSEENGLSHLIEHMIFKGTRRRSAYQIAKEFDAIGGHTNAFTSLENTCYHAKVLDNAPRAQMVDILSDIFLYSLFDASELSREKPVVLQEISMMEDSPDDYIHQLAGNAFWGDHALGRSILGPPENIERFRADTLKQFFTRLYQPERIIIAAAGNLDHDHLIELAAREFDGIRPGTLLAPRGIPEGNARVDIHPRNLEQVHLCLMARGLSTTDPQRYALSLLNTLLGGNMSSRLFQEIRERRGLAYAVYSFVTSFVDAGMFGIYAGVAPDNLEETITPILEILRTITAEPVGADELQDAKEHIRGSLLLASESNENQMVRMAQSEIHFEQYTPMREILDRIERVTAGDIQDLAQKLFLSDKLALTVLGR